MTNGAARAHPETAGQARSSAVVAGFGLGALFDGIVLHQVLQWHHLLTSTGEHPATTVAGLEANTLADGLFHVATWIATFAGLLLLHGALRAGHRPSFRQLAGLLLAGWGIFNLVEGLVDHHLLDLHHVRDLPAHVPAYDWLFLAVGGVGLTVVGWLLSRPGSGPAARPAMGPAARD